MAIYITSWRKTAAEGSILDWDHWYSHSEHELRDVLKNLTSRGVHQYVTYMVTERLEEFSSKY